MKKVNVYDYKTGRITEIPSAELAPGYIQKTITDCEGREQTVFLDGYNMFQDARKDGRLRLVIRPQTAKRPPSDEWTKRCAFLAAAFGDVLPMDAEH